MTWLVTGATGLLGANAGLLLDRAIGVTRTGRVGPGYGSGIAADLSQPAGLAREIRRLRPEVVLHAGALASHEACQADPLGAHRVNVLATGVLAEAAAEAGSHFIYVSTDAVFDGQRGWYAEDDQPNPFSVYGETKLEGELQALAANPQALVARVNFFGWSPSGTRSILEFFVNELSAGRHVRGFTDITVTSIYVSSLLEALTELATRRETGILHVASVDALTKAEFGARVAAAFNLDADLIDRVKALPDDSRRNLSLRTDKAAQLIGPLPSQVEGVTTAHASDSVRHRLQAGF